MARAGKNQGKLSNTLLNGNHSEIDRIAWVLAKLDYPSIKRVNSGITFNEWYQGIRADLQHYSLEELREIAECLGRKSHATSSARRALAAGEHGE